MKRLCMFLSAMIVMPTTVLAQAQDANLDLNLVFSQLFEHINENRPVGYAAAGILILVYLFRKYVLPKTPFNAGVLPWLSILLGVFIGFLGMVSGGASISESVNVMLLSGAGASALWSSLFKLVAKKD
jgi:hypothetical protein